MIRVPSTITSIYELPLTAERIKVFSPALSLVAADTVLVALGVGDGVGVALSTTTGVII